MVHSHIIYTKNMGTVTVTATHWNTDGRIGVKMACEEESIEYSSSNAVLDDADAMVDLLIRHGARFASEDYERFTRFCLADIICNENFNTDDAVKYWYDT